LDVEEPIVTIANELGSAHGECVWVSGIGGREVTNSLGIGDTVERFTVRQVLSGAGAWKGPRGLLLGALRRRCFSAIWGLSGYEAWPPGERLWGVFGEGGALKDGLRSAESSWNRTEIWL
jgi:hypothetical protein